MNRPAVWLRFALAGALALGGAACATTQQSTQQAATPLGDPVVAAEAAYAAAETVREDSLAALMHAARAAVPPAPDLAQPTSALGTRIWRQGVLASGLRIMVDTESRALWLMRDTLVLFSAPVAVGMHEKFEYGGRTYDFTTPLSRRRVLGKDTMPLWVPPDWHYYEIAVEKGLDVVKLRNGQRVELSDGSRLEVRGRDVGRVNQFGNFWAFTPGMEIIFDGKVFVPPFGTRQRQIPDVLGTHKLDMGDGYLIHGTNQETSVGDAVSHGCVRMYNDDVATLYAMVPTGTPVYIY
jgi:hypothetical protein